MSRDCIKTCPLIKSIADGMESDNMWAGPMAFHPDLFSREEDTGIGRLLAMCEASYDCPGPSVQPTEVVKGFLRKRTEIVDQQVCGLPDDYQPR